MDKKETATAELIDFLQPQIGREIHIGPWLQIDQQRINKFAEVTGDQQWIHIDPERAASESPYGATIAHGYLTLSLLPYLTESNHPDFFQKNYPGMKYRVNYGLNKVRFKQMVPAGSRVRLRSTVKSARKRAGALQLIMDNTLEIEGQSKPACIAETIALYFLDD